MKIAAMGLALTGAALLPDCSGYGHISTNGRLAHDDAIAYTQSDSSCDTAGARERSDPASPCIIPRPRADK